MPVFDPAFDISYEAGSFPPAFEIPTFPASVQRYITSLSAAGLMYYSLNDRVLINSGDDFEFESDILFDSNGGHVLTEKGGGTSRFAFASNGDVYIGTLKIGTISNLGVLSDNKLHKMVVRQISNIFTISFDGNLGLTYNQAIPVLRIDALGSSIDVATGIPYFSGILKDAKIWTGGDRNNGTLLHMPIDEDWKTSTDLHDAEGNVVGSAINITENEADFYTLIDDGTAWQSATRTIQIAGGV